MLAGGEPLIAGRGLALRTMPVAAGVIRDGFIAAARALTLMAAQRRCAAPRDGTEYFDVLPMQPRSVVINETIALRANDVSHL